MKVTCQSCQAKYTIADEKVRGKVAKIRCKKCGTTIIVNGTDATGVAPTSDSGLGAVADYAQQGPADEPWMIIVADDDQRTVTGAQIAELFASGAVTYETPAWKDGMADWLPIGQIESLKSFIEHGAHSSTTADNGSAPMASLLPDLPASSPAAMPPLPSHESAPRGAARIHAPEPAAARLRPRSASNDLFGAATHAHDEVMTSASPNPVPHAGGGADRLTGARNENSVLFSLASLTGGAAPAKHVAAAPVEKEPASSKADLRALMGGEAKPIPNKSKLDDIINLSGGGVFSPAMLTAPALAPPPVELPASDVAIGTPKPKGLPIKAIVAGVVLLGAAAAGFMALSGKDATTDKTSASGSASAAPGETAANVAADTPKAPEPAAAPADSAPAAPTVLAPGQSAPKAEPEKKVAAAPRVDKSEKGDKEKPAGGAPNAAALGVPAAAPAPAPAPAPAAGGSGDFDRAAAMSVLSAAATSAQSCKKPDGPTGQGRVTVIFASSGQATTATVEGPPFAGTPVGGCVAGRFRGTHVPPFAGTPMTVHKTFNIN